jgi:hypothetical protein
VDILSAARIEPPISSRMWRHSCQWNHRVSTRRPGADAKIPVGRGTTLMAGWRRHMGRVVERRRLKRKSLSQCSQLVAAGQFDDMACGHAVVLLLGARRASRPASPHNPTIFVPWRTGSPSIPCYLPPTWLTYSMKRILRPSVVLFLASGAFRVVGIGHLADITDFVIYIYVPPL